MDGYKNMIHIFKSSLKFESFNCIKSFFFYQRSVVFRFSWGCPLTASFPQLLSLTLVYLAWGFKRWLSFEAGGVSEAFSLTAPGSGIATSLISSWSIPLGKFSRIILIFTEQENEVWGIELAISPGVQNFRPLVSSSVCRSWFYQSRYVFAQLQF